MSITISTTGDMISTLPACLGFVPQDSILVVLTATEAASGRSQMRAVLRGDLDIAGLTRLVDTAGEVSEREGCDAAAVFVVGTVERSVAETAAAAVADALAAAEVSVRVRAVTAAIEEGEQWIDLDSAEQGTLPDPKISELSLRQIAQGQVLAPSRSAFADELEPDLDLEVARLVSKLAPLTEEDAPASMRTVLADIENGDLSPAALAHTAHVLASLVDVRDALLALAVTDRADQALTHMLAVARRAGSADAYTLVAFYEGIRSRGMRAQIATAHALRLNPLHRFAGLLDQAFAYAITAEHLHTLAASGLETARRIGVDL